MTAEKGASYAAHPESAPIVGLGACAACGRDPALGFASIFRADVEKWYCHPDDGPSCYAKATLPSRPIGTRAFTVTDSCGDPQCRQFDHRCPGCGNDLHGDNLCMVSACEQEV